ncbi:uncharacterized protein LOC123672164 [Harmonia axyridis]|uniref:uncharacterized protein LOC123672164 n=1 Tax=Harmonia axyridis TaxID=115357 RepID=UPI001E2792A2|nr:uncharacterized protein LOC123672164 [Harmonia axyridis]
MSQESQVSRVAFRMPEFVTIYPVLWFAMAEGSFHSARVTQDPTKFGYTVGALPAKYATEVKDIIINPPNDKAYHKLRTELIRRLCATQEEKTRRLLVREEMGDRKPTQFLRYLQGLADSAFPENLMKSLWMNRLSKSVQESLAIVKDSSLQELSVHADHIMEAFRPPVQLVNETTSIEAIISAKLAQLTLCLNQEIATLRVELAAQAYRSRRDRSRGHSEHHPRSHSRGRQPIDGKWYHWRSGARSTRCRQPCNYTSGNEGGLH